MSAVITPTDNIILQPYVTVFFLTELKKHSFLESQFFKEMKFDFEWMKKSILEIGIDNQGCAMMCMYALLVLPKELLKGKYATEFENARLKFENSARNVHTTYKSDNTKIDFIRHVRNAVSHARVAFRPSDCVVFEDENPGKKEKFYAELPLAHLGPFMMSLLAVHHAYITEMKSRIPIPVP